MQKSPYSLPERERRIWPGFQQGRRPWAPSRTSWPIDTVLRRLRKSPKARYPSKQVDAVSRERLAVTSKNPLDNVILLSCRSAARTKRFRGVSIVRSSNRQATCLGRVDHARASEGYRYFLLLAKAQLQASLGSIDQWSRRRSAWMSSPRPPHAHASRDALSSPLGWADGSRGAGETATRCRRRNVISAVKQRRRNHPRDFPFFVVAALETNYAAKSKLHDFIFVAACDEQADEFA
jgi:hypothetical protein